MAKKHEIHSTHFSSSPWLWARIRAVRNYRQEIANIESCLIELVEKIEIEKREILARDRQLNRPQSP